MKTLNPDNAITQLTKLIAGRQFDWMQNGKDKSAHIIFRAGSTLTGYDKTEGSWEVKEEDLVVTKFNNVEYWLKFNKQRTEAVAVKPKSDSETPKARIMKNH